MYFYMLQKSVFHIKINETSFLSIGLYYPTVDTFHKCVVWMVEHTALPPPRAEVSSDSDIAITSHIVLILSNCRIYNSIAI